MKLDIIAGARPNFMKIAPIIHAIKKDQSKTNKIKYRLILTGSMISSVCMNGLGHSPDLDTDNVNIFLNFTDGSNAVINYFSNGSKKYSKERLEVHAQERSWIIDNYRLTKAYGVPGFRTFKTKIDKGHKSQFDKYIQNIRNGGDSLIPINQIINTTVLCPITPEKLSCSLISSA